MRYKPTPGILAARGYRNHPRYRGCVGHWVLNEGAGALVADSSGYYNNGSTVAGTGGLIWVGGQFGPAFNGNGTNGYISIPDAPQFRFTTAMSLSLWTKNNVTPAAYDGLVGKVSNSSWVDGFGLYYFDATTINFFVENVSSYGDSSPIVPLVWNHVVGVYNGTDVAVYVNGVATGAPQAFTGSITGTTAALEFGRLQSDTYNINGQLDEIRLYNRALTKNEITSLYKDPFLEFRTTKRQIVRPSATGTAYTILNSYGVAGGLTTAPLTRDIQQTFPLGTASGVIPGGAQAAVLNSTLAQATALTLAESLSLSQALAFATAGGMATTPLARAIQQGLALAIASGATSGAAQIAALSSALVQSVALALAESLSLSQGLALGAADSITTAPLARVSQQGLSFATAGSVALGSAQIATISSALVQSVALALSEALSFSQALAFGTASGVATTPLARSIQQGLTLGTAGGVSPGNTQNAVLSSALVQAAALAIVESLSLEQILALGASANIDAQIGRALSTTIALACAVNLTEQHTLLRSVTATLTVQAALSVSTVASLEAIVVLTQGAMLTSTEQQTAMLAVALAGINNLSVLADLLGQLQMSIALTSTGALSVVEQFTAIGQVTLATQTMTSIAAQQMVQAVVSLAQTTGFSVSDALGRDVRVALTGGAAIAVLTDTLRVYLISVGLGTAATLTASEQHALAMTVVETVTAVVQSQQSTQIGMLIALGVQPAQAIAATTTMRMLTVIGLQAMLTAAAPLVGINGPQIVRLVNEQLTYAMLANEQVGRAQLTDETLSISTFRDEKIVK